ncbi:Kelch repeat-containing protein [Gaetbulibacter sp. PBL-D1]|uniref:Kelch repeat-containing protein n=1 Tax=Gaetbulibacter sp. PBL-D1 TaxID=3422594 RepID=UPI003D2F2E9E
MQKIALILFLLSLSLHGQTIEGVVLDFDTKIPLESVSVIFKDGKTGTATNSSGKFRLKLKTKPSNKDSITFSAIGYSTIKVSVEDFHKNQNTILLKSKIEALNKVTVTSNIKLKPKISYEKIEPLSKGVYASSSIIINNNVYIVGGDVSHIEDINKRVFKQVSEIPEASLSDFLKALRSNYTWEKYTDKIQVYNLDNETLTTLPSQLQERAYHKIVSVNDSIYVLGGKSLSTNRKREYLKNTIEVVDLNTTKIIEDETFPHQAINFTAIAYDRNIVIMGGSTKLKKNGDKIFTNESHIYNLDSGLWYELKNLTKPKETQGIIIGNTIYLIGGFNGKALKEIESYNLTLGEWTHEADLFFGIKRPSLCNSNDTIYIFDDDNIFTYNTTAKTLKQFKIDLHLKETEMHYYKNALYIFGGYHVDEFSKVPSKKVYKISLKAFSSTKPIETKIFK